MRQSKTTLQMPYQMPFSVCLFFFFSSCITSFPTSLGPKFIEWFLNYLLLLVGVFPVVPVFRGLVGGWSLGGMCHGGKVVSHGDAAGDDAFHGGRYSSRGHADHPRRVPGGGDRERQVCHNRQRESPGCHCRGKEQHRDSAALLERRSVLR